MVDHGSEFPDSATLEQSVLGNRPRTIIYDAYPNRSWKRGSNENGNGFIRYFIPKGHHIGDDSKEEIGNLAKRYKQDTVRSDTGLHFHLYLGVKYLSLFFRLTG